MPKRKRKTKTPPLAGQVFLAKLGDAPSYALKEIAAALYAADRSTQSRLREVLRLGDLIASVYWPDSNVAIALPKEYWAGVKIENFSIREKNGARWSENDYVIRRPVLVRHLVLPKLVQLRDSYGSDRATPSGTKFPPSNETEALGFVIEALQSGSAEAEAFVTASDASEFAKRHFGILERRSRGAPKTDAEHINEALLEAIRRYCGASKLPQQEVLVYEMREWWNKRFESSSRGETWIRNSIVRPLWRALKSPP